MEAANREKRKKLQATKITSDVNADRVKQLRALSVKVPGSGTGAELEGAKEVCEVYKGNMVAWRTRQMKILLWFVLIAVLEV